MLANEKALNLIYEALGELNSSRPSEAQIALSANTKLLGDDGQLDSLDVVEMVVSIEKRLTAQLGRNVVLLDEQIISHDGSPLADVDSLASFLTRQF